MKVNDSPVPKDQNMVDAKLFKGETKVLTSARARETGIVDPEMQISVDEYREIKRRCDQQKSRYERGETSRDGMMRPCVTSRILLNKWQWQKKKDYQRWLEEKKYQRQQEEERYEREQAESHWHCLFFRHCWNEGLRLPTRNNCPECSEQYWKFRQSEVNRQSIHDRIEYQHNDVDRRLKNRSIHDRLGKRVVDQNWAGYEEEDDEEYVWQEGQWCSGDLKRSQKRRVQCLRSRELE